jgi:hypothetical protein
MDVQFNLEFTMKIIVLIVHLIMIRDLNATVDTIV